MMVTKNRSINALVLILVVAVISAAIIISTINRVNAKSYSFKWAEIGIEPFSTEGSNYTITSFDVYDDSKMAIISGYEQNSLLLVNLKKKRILENVILDFIPVDILIVDNTIYVLTNGEVVAFDLNGKIQNRYPLKEEHILRFDKLLEISGRLALLMADGSSYILGDSQFIKEENLPYDNDEIWIEKNNRYSFSLKSNTGRRVDHSSTLELGSITIAGGAREVFCCIDKIISKDPFKIIRTISSDQTEFSKDLIILPDNAFSYVKNDFKIHEEEIWYIEIDEEGFVINSSNLK